MVSLVSLALCLCVGLCLCGLCLANVLLVEKVCKEDEVEQVAEGVVVEHPALVVAEALVADVVGGVGELRSLHAAGDYQKNLEPLSYKYVEKIRLKSG